MQTIEVRAQADHLEGLARVKPLNALSELIWNAVDADAQQVSIQIDENGIGGIDRIIIEDDGTGISYNDAQSAFGYLGGSWKKSTGKTKREKRVLHGRDGKGRFRAFALGKDVVWHTRFKDQDSMKEYTIRGSVNNLKQFQIDTPRSCDTKQTGTIVTISSTFGGLGLLSDDGNAGLRLSEIFAIYLRDYPNVRMAFRGEEINPTAAQKDFSEYPLPEIEIEPNRKVQAVLQIIEWNSKRERKLCLCSREGFTLHEIDAKIRPGSDFNFTAYLRSDYISELNKENRLELGEFNKDLMHIVDEAREKIRTHFREKKSRSAVILVQEWKDEGIYPFVGESLDPVEVARRQVFEICALNVHDFLDDFRKAETKSRKFTLRMLRQALEDNPESLQRILQEVLDLPTDKREELAELLHRTTLSAIIGGSKLVTERLDFLKGLEELLFNSASKKELEERSQLHKILEDETWIFGEEFYLTASDETLTTVLKKHLGKLRPKEKIAEVLRDDGRRGIIDLMLAREVPQNRKNRCEFLVVELKAPKQKIDLEVKGQIESYALAVVRDERFGLNHTHWTFLAVSNELTDDARETISQEDKPYGIFLKKDHYCVGLVTWAEILQNCRTRLELFREKLGYVATTDSGVALLRTRYSKYLPPALQEKNDLS